MAHTNAKTTFAQTTDYEAYKTTGSWSSNVPRSEPDDRLDAAEGATWDDALALERKAAAVGITVQENYLAYLADDRSEFPAGKEHSANAQMRFVAGDDPVDEYLEAPGWNGAKQENISDSRIAFARANMVAGEGPFGDPRNITNTVHLTPEDLADLNDTDDDPEGRTDGGENTDDDADEWTPSPATLREGETPDEDTHARRNLEQIRMARAERDADEEDRTRFDVVEDECYGNHYRGDTTSSDLFGYVSAGGGRDSDEVAEVLTHTFSPGGVTGRGRPVYEVHLQADAEEVVPVCVLRVAAYRDLDVTAVETIHVEGEDRTRLLLEPADTDRFPRTVENEGDSDA